MPVHYEVAIIGFGPVGMSLAGLLGRSGISVLAIEKDVEVFSSPRAAHIDHTGLRTLQEIGCLSDLMAQMIPNRGLDLVDAGLNPLVRVPGDQGSVSGLPASMYFYQPIFDRGLERAVSAIPSVRVLRGHTLDSLAAGEQTCAVRCTDTDGRVVEFTADWVVGCDGSSSTVREALGIGLESLSFDERWLVLDLISRDEKSSVIDHSIQVCDPDRPYVANPIPGGRYRAEFKVFDEEDVSELTRTDTLRAMLAPLFGSLPLEVERSAVYTFHGLVADSWRVGRVLLAGDAAHQMPPFLGQGMCSGMRDASNLAWKLARVVRDGAPTVLLDTYQSERSEHVRAVVESAVAYGRLVSGPNVGDAEKVLDAEQLTAMRFRLPRLNPGPLVLASGGYLFPQPVGDVGLDDVVGGRFLALALDRKSLGQAGEWWQDQLGALVAVPAELGPPGTSIAAWMNARGIRAAVVRPDRYVLGTADSLDEITRLAAAELVRGFGVDEPFPASVEVMGCR